MGIMLNIGVQAGKIEAVENVVLFDFAEVLVAFGRQEPRDPLLPSVKRATTNELSRDMVPSCTKRSDMQKNEYL